MEWAGAGAMGLLALLMIALIAALAGLFARRRWLSRQGGMFDLAVRPHSEDGTGGWTLGVGRYGDDALQWFKVFSLSWRPRRRFRQGEWTVAGSRDMLPAEASQLYQHQRVVHVVSRDGLALDLAMDAQSVIAFISWLEAAGPGVAKYGNTVE